MKHKFIWFICIILLLSACTNSGDVSDLPDVTMDVQFVDTRYTDSILYTQLWKVSEEDQMDHTPLQREVGKIPITYPITTADQTVQYANALHKICVSLELLDPELIPGDVIFCSDGVFVIEFVPEGMHDKRLYEGACAHALISAKDGHVIVFEISD